MKVPEILEQAAATFKQRNELYGNNYHRAGDILVGLFPSGLKIESAEEWNRLCLIIHEVTKLTRYCEQFKQGGHKDSARDMVVYSAMLEEITTDGG